ncbi:hypothetical protein MALL_0845 [Mycoplasmopsis alligatoris A21JP2]|uniref:Uncharacterized protein n=1 Tax=Mycoplasmopsis alligatoris A21JP2 TaxID=747682 RepID=D4XWA8_9BACT|nr:hypothetical protein MALL_0845 [Mycoplasmopsis alligatoris A21JP2]
MPASMITGRSISSNSILIKSLAQRPRLEPIGDARGMMQAAPAFARSRAALRSGNI